MGKIVRGVQQEVLEGQSFSMLFLLTALMAEVAQKFRTAIWTYGGTMSFCHNDWLRYRHLPLQPGNEAEVYPGFCLAPGFSRCQDGAIEPVSVTSVDQCICKLFPVNHPDT